jgi:hypothetical protein
LSCSICHDGRKQELRSKAACPHAKHCTDVIDAAAMTTEEPNLDILRMNEVLTRTSTSTAGSTTFDTARGIYIHASLSATNEAANNARCKIPVENVELSLSDIRPDGCQLGGLAHIPRSDPSDLLSSLNPLTLRKRLDTMNAAVCIQTKIIPKDSSAMRETAKARDICRVALTI